MSQDKEFQDFCEMLESSQRKKLDDQHRRMCQDAYNNAAEYKNNFDAMIKRTEAIQKRLHRAQNDMSACNLLDAGEKLVEIKRAMHWLDKNINNLIGSLPSEIDELYQAELAEKMNEDIEVAYTDEGWLYIEMPALLPHKKKSFNRSKIYYSLSYSIDNFIQEHGRHFYEKAVIIIRHVYGKDIPTAQRKDCDNIETSIVINAVSPYFLRDDSYDVLSIFVTAETGEKSRTEIFLVPEKSFIVWNVRYKRVSEHGV